MRVTVSGVDVIVSTGRRALLPLLVVLSLALAACGDPDPADELASAFDDTLDGDFAYALAIDADADALGVLGEEAAGQAAAFLSGLQLSGAKQGEAVSIGLDLLGQSNIVEMRSIGGGTVYLNLGIDDLLSVAGAGGFDPRNELIPAMEELGIGEDSQAAVLAALDGEWIAIEGAGAAGVVGGFGDADGAAILEALGGDFEGFVEEYVTVVERVEEDGFVRYDVAVALRDLIRELAAVDGETAFEDLEADLTEIPETVPGQVETVDGMVAEVRVDLSAPADSEDDQPGAVDLVLELSDFGEVGPVDEPEPSATLTEAQFQEVVEALTGGLTGSAAPTG